MKVALYSRVSTEKQETENQLRELREFCTRSGYEIVGEYVDVMTGSSPQRVRFKDMFADASKRKFEMVLFWSLDRFTREGVLKTLNYLNELESQGIAFKSYTERYLDSAGMFKEAIISILATLAKQERQRTKERVKSGISLKRVKVANLGQKWQWGRKPLPEETVARIRELHEREQLSVRKIAKACNVSVGAVHKTLKALGA